MSQPDIARITAQLLELRQAHRDLDTAIESMTASGQRDELTIKRLKKRRLRMKDMIAALESRLIPDLDA